MQPRRYVCPGQTGDVRVDGQLCKKLFTAGRAVITCHQGLGTPQDSAEAKSWYESGLQSLTRGRGLSCLVTLGNVPGSVESRPSCLLLRRFAAEEKSAAQGNLDAQFNLAVVLLTGGFRPEFMHEKS